MVRLQYPSPLPERDVTIGAEPVGVDSIPENGIYDPTTPKAEVRLPVHVPVDL